MKRFVAPVLLLVAALAGCAGSDFSGGGNAGQEKKAKSSPSSGDPEDGLGNANKEEDAATTFDPGDGSQIVNDKPVLGEKVAQFGGDKVFHLGDGQMQDSTCILELSTYPLSGNTFIFEFDVLNDMTLVEVAVDVCGVDIIDTNFASLQSSGTKMQELRLVPSSLNLAFKAQVLNKGRYSIVIESRNGSQDKQWTVDDHDDYMVKQVLIKTDKGVQKGNVTAK